jgi:Flavoprotein
MHTFQMFTTMADSDRGVDNGENGSGADVTPSLHLRNPPILRRRRRPCRPFRVLLGITGSVAAVKGPELILQLMDALSSTTGDDDTTTTSSVEIRVVLTRGGSNFWKCANEYDPISWRRLQERLHESTSDDVATAVSSSGPQGVLIYGTDSVQRQRGTKIYGTSTLLLTQSTPVRIGPRVEGLEEDGGPRFAH